MNIHDKSDVDDLLAWLEHNYSSSKIVMTSSFGLEGCALIDMAAKAGLRIDVANIDTGFLFPETLQLRDQLASRYSNLNFISWKHGPSDLPENKPLKNERLWESQPSKCCYLRKVKPLEENIKNYQVWITAIRRSQSASRKDTELVQFDWSYLLLKVCPLAHWSREQVWQYVQENNVPHNKLHYEGYPSIGCTHCTLRVEGVTSPLQYSRDGRWQGQEKTECGLHTLKPKQSFRKSGC